MGMRVWMATHSWDVYLVWRALCQVCWLLVKTYSAS